MTDLVVRRLLINLEAPFDRHWCGGDAFRSAFFNALSMSFPAGEQFFIDAVRDGLKQLSPEQLERFKAEVQGFIGQEATHRRIHSLFNAHLEKQGLVNGWEVRSLKDREVLEGEDVRHWLAITAANEHFTAIFAEWMLTYPEWLDGSEERLKTMWLWHSAEEAEHKSTAFDLYLALGGNHAWRVKWMRRVTFVFWRDAITQTLSNLRRNGSLWRLGTWSSAARFFFGKKGLVRFSFRRMREYMRADFHPRQHESALSRNWLDANAGAYSVVGG